MKANSLVFLFPAFSPVLSMTVPGIVLRRGVGDNACPSAETVREAKENLSNIVLQLLSSQPQCGPGEWRQVVSLDMSNSTHQCPSGWMEYSSPNRSCGRTQSHNASCDQASFLVSGKYSWVCGRARARETSTSDGFKEYGERDDENYVDGISVTYSSPRRHIWTFSADHYSFINCPCNNASQTTTPAFVGNNYFCDTEGNGAFLWDGDDCSIGIECCTFNSPPWFSIQLPIATTEYIDVRLCGDQNTFDENVIVEEFELFVQ